MSDKDVTMHLTAERIQALLDGALVADERISIDEHVTSCTHCRAELETWELLYSELGTLTELAPSEGFAAGVLAQIESVAPAPEGAAASSVPVGGAWGWLRHRTAKVAKHVAPERLQDYVDGVLPRPQMARVEAHLEACVSCRQDAAGWHALIQGVESLPEFSPAPGFTRRIMSQVRIGRLVRAPSSVTARGRVVAWAGRLVPRTRKAWAVISGIAVTPATVMALLVYAVFSNPALTPSHLASFVWWQVSGAASALTTLAVDTFFESAVVYRGYSALEALSGAPVLAAMLAVSLAAATSVSGWVLYRNLLPNPKLVDQYATASI